MNKTLALGLAALSAVFMISCGANLGASAGSKKDTKVQFYNNLWYSGGYPFVAEFWIDDTNVPIAQRPGNGGVIKVKALSGEWSPLTKMTYCDKETTHEVVIFDGPWAEYVFRNVPLRCEADNQYNVYAFGGWPTFNWSVSN